MSDVWEHSDRAVCTHPGWATLRGWSQISASWVALFTGSQRLQFILTNERPQVMGDTAWVSLDENILSDEVGGTVAALNVLARVGAGPWKVVVHHGSPVAAGGG
jgi:ketosteroid isomerase-like protein